MKVLYYSFFCGEGELGECYGFFELKGKTLELVAAWDANDASYRHEYMSGLFKHVGIEMTKLPDRLRKKAVKLVEEAFGL